MNNPNQFPIRMVWLYLIMFLALALLTLSGSVITKRGINLSIILAMMMSLALMFQCWSFLRRGYLMFSKEQVTINHGFRKTQLNLEQIESISKRRNLYEIRLKNGKSCYVSMNFIPKARKNELDKKIQELTQGITVG